MQQLSVVKPSNLQNVKKSSMLLLVLDIQSIPAYGKTINAFSIKYKKTQMNASQSILLVL